MAEHATPTPTPSQIYSIGPNGWMPIPDPTVLTTQAVDAAKEQLRRVVDRLEQLQVTMNERFEGRHLTVLELFGSLKTRLTMLLRQLNRALVGKEQVLDEYAP